MIHHHPFSLRIMVAKHDAIRLDEYATAWKARKIFETTHISNMSIERVYSFYSENNKKQFEKRLSQFLTAKVV